MEPPVDILKRKFSLKCLDDSPRQRHPAKSGCGMRSMFNLIEAPHVLDSTEGLFSLVRSFCQIKPTGPNYPGRGGEACTEPHCGVNNDNALPRPAPVAGSLALYESGFAPATPAGSLWGNKMKFLTATLAILCLAAAALAASAKTNNIVTPYTRLDPAKSALLVLDA
jgi:hypothetical protein